LASTLQEVFSVGDDGESIQVDLEPATPSSTQPAIPTSIGRNTSRERQPMARKAGGAKNASSLFSLTVHEPTNSIILTAPRPMLVQAERLIERLDHHRPQVLIDVTIVSVSESRSLDLGIDIQHLHTDPSGNVDRGVLSSFGLLNVDPVSGSTTAQFGGGLNAVLLRPEEVSIMLRAFRSKLNGQVVAQPRLLVDDNASGNLNSISEQPYTSINSGQTVSTTSFAGYAEAGTQLTLTPHISEGGVVHLDYEIRSSSFTGSSPSGNTPPPRATDSIRSQVTIPSGYVLLVGGLTREDQTNAHSEVPLLADIPILGELFRIRTESRRRTVLYVFLTPRILKEDRFAYLKHISRQSLKQTPVEPDMPDLKMEFLP
jgi:general secretion pathway protein D